MNIPTALLVAIVDDYDRRERDRERQDKLEGLRARLKRAAGR